MVEIQACFVKVGGAAGARGIKKGRFCNRPALCGYRRNQSELGGELWLRPTFYFSGRTRWIFSGIIEKKRAKAASRPDAAGYAP